MQFLVYRTSKIHQISGLKYPFVALYQDNWNDFGFTCRFLAEIHLSDEEIVDLGAVRIALGDKGFRSKDLPTVLESLPKMAASLGESIAYYRRIGALPSKLSKDYLRSIFDIVAKPTRRKRIKSESLWESSFMREASSRQAHQRGGFYIDAPHTELEPPSFRFEMKLAGAAAPHVIDIDFKAHGGLPNRTMLLIGRNGTGKTHLLSNLAFRVMPPQVFSDDTRKLMPKSEITPPPNVSRVITISYNVFDEFPLPMTPARAPRPAGVAYRSRASYKYCGLRTPQGTINSDEIGKMLGEALEPVIQSDRTERLQEVLSTFLGKQVAIGLMSDNENVRDAAVAELSAGQRLVAAIFSNIVGFIEDGSLLLIDEPETNLHPGLLSSVISALNYVLREFDSYAVIATHSPILLQQIPSRYVRVITRNNLDIPIVRALDFESFGEDLGELSRRVLGLTDAELDFTDVLSSLYSDLGSVKAVQELFRYPLGVPAQAHLFALEEGLLNGDGAK